MWDLVCEANGTEAWCDGDTAYNTRLQSVKNSFDSYDPFAHLTTASQGGGWNAWDSDPKWPNGYAITGVSQMHSYEYKDNMDMKITLEIMKLLFYI
ncbi:MAG: hypothetical protein LLG37_05695 [Spirochaetia bacterium]|nr:hypothetical protein [Spirochaetia bacterium]